MWNCKDCDQSFTRLSHLLRHFKLDHRHFGRGHSYPCTYTNCPCTFKTWNALLSHLSRCHPSVSFTTQQNFLFKCHICEDNQQSSEADFFHHIAQHLKNFETVTCVYVGCSYKTNVYGSFKTHKWRKHKSETVNNFKPGIVINPVGETGDNSIDCAVEQIDEDFVLDIGQDSRDILIDIEHKVASVLLKLENIFLVPSAAVNELLNELQYLIGKVSVPAIQNTLTELLQNHNCEIDQPVVQEIASALCTSNPIQAAISSSGPLSTAWKRRAYYKQYFSVVEPIEYEVDAKNRRSLQYIPILKSLQQILNCPEILENTFNLSVEYQQKEGSEYRSIFDGLYFKQNSFLSNNCTISLILYIDDFEICNPLGTSRKKHKVCAVYWTLGNLAPGYQSSLSSIYLASLINSNDVKSYGFEKVLEPLINDLCTLEQHGVFIAKFGKTLKGTVQCVVSDNLAAHSLAGFVESFSGTYVCRYCTGERQKFKESAVSTGAFCIRTEAIHSDQLQTLAETQSGSYFGVKKSCILSQKLSHFKVTTSFPPDILHDIFEGVVPLEIALCLKVLISKKYFTLSDLNTAILKFDYKWSDKTNRPHIVPATYACKGTVGGNSHENWSLLRFLPFLIGQRVPTDKPFWQILTDLKDIVDIVVSPFQTEESIAYLEFKISEHRVRYLELFPDSNLIPKQHFLEHYPQLIRNFGPLVALWTMRFEAKHSFFKRVVRHTHCFKNVLHSMSERHQFQLAHHIYTCSFRRRPVEVSHVTTLPVHLLKDDIVTAVKHKYPDLEHVCLAKSVVHNGHNYRIGMIAAHGSLAGLPDFFEIVQIIVVADKLSFIVRRLSSLYREHYRAYELQADSTKVGLLEVAELTDPYPLIDYKVGGKRLVTVKRYIHV